MTALNEFEKSLTDMLKILLAKPEYACLRIAPNLEIIPKADTVVQLANTADETISGSFKVQSLVADWLKACEELEVYLPNHTLRISLLYRFEPEQDKSATNTDKDLPVFTPTKPRYTLDRVILPVDVKQRIMADLRAISHMNLVYKEWGFEEVDAIPRLVLSFYGKPGTGKTMLAHAIADYFGKQLLALNYSEIESKYVGDAAKNLKNAFETAKKIDAVLFFDEADSFLGKRIQNVSQGAEQAINSLRSQMLILLEEYEGIVLFATNLVSNFDNAFESRFIDSIEIPMPNIEARAEIIKGMIPKRLPLVSSFTDEQYMEASGLIEGIAGREIKNAILKMLLNKADRVDYRFTIDDLFEALTNKMDELKTLHKDTKLDNVQKISATPEQLEDVKSVIKESINTEEMRTVKL